MSRLTRMFWRKMTPPERSSHRIPMSAFKRLLAACENPPPANQALKDFIRKGLARVAKPHPHEQ